MLYVLDCSVALKWFLPDEQSDIAESVLALYEGGQVSFTAPDSLVPEFGHSMRSFVLGGRLPPEVAATRLATFLAMRIDLISSAPLAPQALQLALTEMGHAPGPANAQRSAHTHVRPPGTAPG